MRLKQVSNYNLIFMKYTIKYTPLLFFALLTLTGCRITRPYQAPQAETGDLFRDNTATDTTSLATVPWKEIFRDSLLQQLITTGIANNLDLKVAYTRLHQAEAYYSQGRAALYPSLNANISYTESKLSDAQGFGIRTHMSQYNVGLSSSWEADVWGRLSSVKRSNLAALLQSQAGTQAVQSGVVADIAQLYYTLLALDRQLKIAQTTVENWEYTVQTMQKLKVSARVTEAAVVQSRAQKYAVEVTIPDLRQQIRETENALNILLGQAPGPVLRSTMGESEIYESITAGVPAQLLANRPDVRQAELSYRSTFEMTNASKAAFYPTLSITGSAGFNSLTLDKVLSPSSMVASIMGGLTQPIFNRRLLKTNLKVAEQEQEAAYLNYKNTLLVAGQEVSDALSLYHTAGEKIPVRSHQVEELDKSVQYTQKLLSNGFADYLEVITARQNLLSAELSQVNDRLQQLQAVVALYRALGGGWQ